MNLAVARDLVLSACPPLPTDVVPIADALGRVLARPLIATADLPPFPNSAMDGFAVTVGPAGRTLRLAGESLAGKPATSPVDETTAVRVSTGAALPPHAAAVVPDEQASLRDGLVELHVAAPAGLNIRLAGEDIPAGREILDAGRRLGPFELAVAIGTGHGEVVCHRRPRVALLATGNELRPPGSRLEPGQIHDTNTTTLAALAMLCGADVVSRSHAADERDDTRRAVAAALEAADLLIITGGVSVGPQDHVRSALTRLGVDEKFAGLDIRPGRPAWFGTRADRPVFALPGNPVAAIVVFVLLVRPALTGLAGHHPPAPSERVRLAAGVNPSPRRTSIVGARLREAPSGAVEIVPTGPLSAHATSPLLGIDALAIIPPGSGHLDAGTLVEIVRVMR
jgi:molybdopterin molybdotransferase